MERITGKFCKNSMCASAQHKGSLRLTGTAYIAARLLGPTVADESDRSAQKGCRARGHSRGKCDWLAKRSACWAGNKSSCRGLRPWSEYVDIHLPAWRSRSRLSHCYRGKRIGCVEGDLEGPGAVDQ